jgi:hypothetical protein
MCSNTRRPPLVRMGPGPQAWRGGPFIIDCLIYLMLDSFIRYLIDSTSLEVQRLLQFYNLFFSKVYAFALVGYSRLMLSLPRSSML